jgi:hypothetical protein
MGTVWGFFGEKEGPNPTKDVYQGRKREGERVLREGCSYSREDEMSI